MILEELAAASAGEEGTGDDEAELLAGGNLEFYLHQKLKLESRVEGERGPWRNQGSPCPCHPLHVLLHPLPEDRLHRGQRRLPPDNCDIPHLIHPAWIHSTLHLCPRHQWCGQRWWCLFHAFQNNGPRVWWINW